MCLVGRWPSKGRKLQSAVGEEQLSCKWEIVGGTPKKDIFILTLWRVQHILRDKIFQRSIVPDGEGVMGTWLTSIRPACAWFQVQVILPAKTTAQLQKLREMTTKPQVTLHAL
ncbi:uncharacterized protein ACDP82_009709 [Pangshura tecta]